MDDHTLQQVIDLAVKTAVLKAKKEAILECRPIGSYFITETEDDPNILFGGEWQKLTGRYVLQCSDANHKAGTTVEAGLPDINGAISGVFAWGDSGSGVFSDSKKEGPVDFTVYNPMGHQWRTLDFKASNFNVIYGNSDTVQPPARIVNVWKRVS